MTVDFAGFSGENLHGAIAEPLDKVPVRAPPPHIDPCATPGARPSESVEPGVAGRRPERQPAVPGSRSADHGTAYIYYPAREHTISLDSEPTPTCDLGKETILFPDSAEADPEAVASQYVQQSRMWFDSAWSTVARQHSHQ